MSKAPQTVLPLRQLEQDNSCVIQIYDTFIGGERDGSVVGCRTPEREVGGSKPTSAVLCP